MKNALACLKAINGRKIIFFGTGSVGKNIAQNFPLPIAYFVDNDPGNWGTEVLGIPICPPEQLLKENKDQIAIVITSMYYLDISKQLTNLGFIEEKHIWNGYKAFHGLTIPGGQTITLEYPVHFKPRYGWGNPPNSALYEIIDRGRADYACLISQFAQFQENFGKIPLNAPDDGSATPYWGTTWLPAIDAISLYGLVALHKPKRYYEVGSGNSTKFVRRAIKDHNLPTKILSVDPCPRAEIDAICDKVVRSPLEDVNPDLFLDLEAGDILFIDSSHMSFMNSDVTVAFLEILPRLKPGVIVGIHDVFLPYDYPDFWVNRYFSEQYLLACYMLGGNSRFDVLFPAYFIGSDPVLQKHQETIYTGWGTPQLGRHGGAFWVTMK